MNISKIVKKASVSAVVYAMLLTALPMVSYANEGDEILAHNKSLLSGMSTTDIDGYGVKNNWVRLKLDTTAITKNVGPDSILQYYDGDTDLAKGFLLPENLNLDLFGMDQTTFWAGSLGVTGSEVEKFKPVADAMGESDAFQKVKYPVGDLSIKNDSVSVFKSTLGELSSSTIDLKSNLEPLKAWEEFATPGDTSSNKTTYSTYTYIEMTLPDGLSFNSSDIKNSIKLNNSNYEVESARVTGKKVTIKLTKYIRNMNLTDLKNQPYDILDIDLGIGGIKYDNSVRLGNKYTIKASLYGLVDNYDRSSTPTPQTRLVNVFAARQSDSGKDSGSNLGDNIMSVTVALKYNTVTFKVDGQPDKPVLVETGKSINGDIDNTQSMPSDPTKSGYTFKGWFTQPNGGGTRFDGNTPVNSDITVYAYFERTPSNPGRGGGGGTTPDPGRVDGGDRVETGIKISQKYYDKAKTVIVVRHDLFPDSMTASVLAKLKDAPILLNPTNKLDPRVGAEMNRLGAEEVIIVGGPDSISEKVRGDLKVYDKDKDVERIAGVDRYGTSEMVARRVTGITGKKNTGVIASGQVFPDALSVGTFASRDGYPILLVKKNLVPDQVVRAIKDLDIKKTYIAGGTNTISKSTEAKLPGVLERMAGKDRYETSVAIAKSKFRDSREAFIASGEEFADALVISPVSGKYNRPTLLASRNKKTNAVVKKYIEESYLTSITAIGGEKYLPNSIMLDLAGK
nr:cell wall-binding repeat-containing protein [uncultured Peptostreptococcus sp.]